MSVRDVLLPSPLPFLPSMYNGIYGPKQHRSKRWDQALDRKAGCWERRLRRVENVHKASMENRRDCFLGQPRNHPAAEQARWAAMTL